MNGTLAPGPPGSRDPGPYRPSPYAVWARRAAGTVSRDIRRSPPYSASARRDRRGASSCCERAVHLGCVFFRAPALSGEPRFRSGTRLSRRVYPRVCGGATGDPPTTRHTRLPPCRQCTKNRLRHDGITRRPKPCSFASRMSRAALRGSSALIRASVSVADFILLFSLAVAAGNRTHHGSCIPQQI